MTIGQLPEPGTPEFAQLARYRRAVLQGQVPAGTTFEQFRAAESGTAAPGTKAFAVQAYIRRATIARTPIPVTTAPPVLQEPARIARESAAAIATGAKAAGEAAVAGLKMGTAVVVVGLAALIGFALWRR